MNGELIFQRSISTPAYIYHAGPRTDEAAEATQRYRTVRAHSNNNTQRRRNCRREERRQLEVSTVLLVRPLSACCSGGPRPALCTEIPQQPQQLRVRPTEHTAEPESPGKVLVTLFRAITHLYARLVVREDLTAPSTSFPVWAVVRECSPDEAGAAPWLVIVRCVGADSAVFGISGAERQRCVGARLRFRPVRGAFLTGRAGSGHWRRSRRAWPGGRRPVARCPMAHADGGSGTIGA